ncbi:MAG: hypothetical protein ABSC20_11870 [Candidatus Bathyarchaeia archaeon]
MQSSVDPFAMAICTVVIDVVVASMSNITIQMRDDKNDLNMQNWGTNKRMVVDGKLWHDYCAD